MRISFQSRGSFKTMETFLQRMSRGDIFRELEGLAQEGVAALSAATPKNSGTTSVSWGCEVKVGFRSSSITWTNTNVEDGFPVAIMLQYGHGTGTGGWVSGQDFINPTIKPVFDKIANKAWKAVTSA